MVSQRGYYLIRQDRVGNKRGGGLCIFIKDNIDVQYVSDTRCDVDSELVSGIVE